MQIAMQITSGKQCANQEHFADYALASRELRDNGQHGMGAIH
jgi:hypothetical protein